MLIGFLRIALPAALCAAFGVQSACADIYTWVDASGTINVSNLAPPDGVRVTSVIHSAPPDPAEVQAAREAQLRALAERVVQLEQEVQVAQRQAPPPLLYPPVAPPPVQFITEVAPVQYVVNSAPAASPSPGGCDGSWTDCGFSWAPVFYPVGGVVLRPPNFPRPHPFQSGPRFGGPPMHASFGNFRRS